MKLFTNQKFAVAVLFATALLITATILAFFFTD